MSSRARTLPPNRTRVAAAALLTCAALLSGCSSSMIEDHLPTAAGGLPDDAPAKPKVDGSYPAVHNMPPARATTPLSYDQQKQLEDDLVAARNRYGSPDAPAATGSTGNAPAATGSTGNSKAGSPQNP